MLQELDAVIIKSINTFSRKYPLFDEIILLLNLTYSFRLLPIVACFVVVWFRNTNELRDKTVLLMGLLGGALSLLVSRSIQGLSSNRPRPLHSESLGFVLPYGMTGNEQQEWSSFPSDTTALAFALAAAIWCASKPLGWGCFIWSAVLVGLPRVYAGLHYPSDIIGGAILGTSLTLLIIRFAPYERVMAKFREAVSRASPLVYGFGFIVLFQITTMFSDVRWAASILRRGLAQMLSAGP